MTAPDMSEISKQIIQSIQEALDSDWANWEKLAYVRSRIRMLRDEERHEPGHGADGRKTA